MLEGLQKRIYALCLVLFCALCLAVIPAVGYAEDYDGGGGSHNIGGSYPNFGTVWFDKTGVSNGIDVSPVRVRYGVVAFSSWDAAMYCLRGTNFSDSVSNTKKRKLLADSDFRDFGNLFRVGKPEATNDWSGDASIVLAWNSARELYGETYCYSVIYTLDQWYAADAALQRIMNEDDEEPGGSTDGGGNVGSANDYVYFDVLTDNTTTPTQYAGLAINVSYFNDMLSFLNANSSYYLWISVGKYAGSGQANYYTISCINEKPELNYADAAGHWDSITWIRGSQYCGLTQNHASTIEYAGKTYLMMNEDTEFDSEIRSTNSVLDACRPIYGYYWGGPEEPEDPTQPPKDWPDPPVVTTVPPDIPNPGDPTVPTPPDPPNPWSPIPGIDIDITGDDFQDLLDALNEHCIHLQTSIQDNISQLWSLQSDLISDRFDWLGNDVIIPSFTDLKDYLHQLFEWLAERMNFNINYTNGAYDDTSVVTWLKKIWSKMGDGINTQPTDPVTEPDDWWAWLLALMSNFVSMLLAFGSDKLGDVMDGLSSLTGKFPFSLPWDLLALLAMLDAPPQTPEWDLPCFAVSLEGLQQVSSYHISLEDYDTVWENVRWIERLSFIVLLVRSTDLFTGMMRRAVGNRD